MAYLLLSITSTGIVYLLFRAFGKYSIHGPSAIVVNYLTALIASLLMSGENLFEYFEKQLTEPILFAGLMGIALVVIFNFLNLTTQILGVAGSTIVSRISMVIPAIFFIIYFSEPIGVLKIAGIAIALVAIYLAVFRRSQADASTNVSKYQTIVIPLIAFAGTGLVDILIMLSQRWYFPEGFDKLFLGLVFLASFIGGMLMLIIKRNLKSLAQPKNLAAGVILGLSNYLALHFFYLALETGFEGSKVFPMNSVGIVVFSSLASAIIFKEKLEARKLIGIGLAVTAILMIGLS